MVTLKPCQKRRLVAELTIYGMFDTFKECVDACNELAKSKGSTITFNKLSIQQYIGCQTNFSMKRLNILAELLNVTNYRNIDEVFVAPEHRGIGKDWIGDNGNTVRDMDMTLLNQDDL